MWKKFQKTDAKGQRDGWTDRLTDRQRVNLKSPSAMQCREMIQNSRQIGQR
jgi:hypothetical protein